MATGTIKRDGLKNLIEVGTVNLNTLTQTGWYHGTLDSTVTLTGVDSFFCLVVNDGAIVKQFIIGEFAYGTTLWMRYYNGSTWTNKRVDFGDRPAPDISEYISLRSVATDGTTSGFHFQFPNNASFTCFYYDTGGRVAIMTKANNSDATLTELNGTFVAKSLSTTEIFIRTGVYTRASFQITSSVLSQITITPY